MNRTLLIVYEPALFLLAALGWAGWELWSVRARKTKREAGHPPQHPDRPRDASPKPADTP